MKLTPSIAVIYILTNSSSSSRDTQDSKLVGSIWNRTKSCHLKTDSRPFAINARHLAIVCYVWYYNFDFSIYSSQAAKWLEQRVALLLVQGKWRIAFLAL